MITITLKLSIWDNIIVTIARIYHKIKILFFDIEDYINSNVIGPTNIEVPCTIWEDMYTTSREVSNAFTKALDEFIVVAKSCDNGTNCEPTHIQAIYQNFYPVCYINWQVAQAKFWNTQICIPLTGVIPQDYDTPDGLGGKVTTTVNVDFGSGVLTEGEWAEYLNAQEDFYCCLKQTLNLLTGDTFPETVFDEFISSATYIP